MDLFIIIVTCTCTSKVFTSAMSVFAELAQDVTSMALNHTVLISYKHIEYLLNYIPIA